MARRSKQDRPELLRLKLAELLADFQEMLKSSELRSKVTALVPAYHHIRDLGGSLIPPENASSARERILYYLRKYPNCVISGEELMVVAGISEWARRVRELRVEHGWRIVTGVTVQEMADQEDFQIEKIGGVKLKPDDYVLVDNEQDRDAADRWNLANEIRKSKTSMRDKILYYLRKNVGQPVTGDELRYVAQDKTEWARRVRELRTELGWPIQTSATGRPDLPVGIYLLESDRQSPEHDRVIPDHVRRAVLRRDGYRCQHCGWHHELWNPDDPRHLELHHQKQHVHGGENTEDNLLSLCNICHDVVHKKGKKGR